MGIHERNPHFLFLFLHFLANLPQNKYLICATPSFPKTTLLFSNLPFTIFNHTLYQNSPIHFPRHRQQTYTSIILTFKRVPFSLIQRDNTPNLPITRQAPSRCPC